MEKYKTIAIIITNAAAYATPSSDNSSANKKHKTWTKFIQSFDWDKMEEKKEKHQTVGGFLSLFKSFGVKTSNSNKESE